MGKNYGFGAEDAEQFVEYESIADPIDNVSIGRGVDDNVEYDDSNDITAMMPPLEDPVVPVSNEPEDEVSLGTGATVLWVALGFICGAIGIFVCFLLNRNKPTMKRALVMSLIGMLAQLIIVSVLVLLFSGLFTGGLTSANSGYTVEYVGASILALL